MYKTGFMLTLAGGTFFVLSASSWFNAWVGLELNMLSFIPLVVKPKDVMGAEAGISYFLIQTVASIVILLMVTYKELEFKGTGESEVGVVANLTVWGVGLALAMKLGMAPLHFWLPSIVENLSWVNQAILLTWQKIAPLWLMSVLPLSKWGVSSLVVLSVSVGGLGGLVQTSLAKLMAYSSINHMGWMGGALLTGGSLWMVYFIIYGLMTISVIWVLNLKGCYQVSHLWTKNSISTTTKMGLFVGFLSMGGLPPFLGFFPKWAVASELVAAGEFALVVLMMLMTLVTLYYYFRVVFVVFVYTNTTPKLEKGHTLKRGYSIGWGLGLVGLNIMGLFGWMVLWV